MESTPELRIQSTSKLSIENTAMSQQNSAEAAGSTAQKKNYKGFVAGVFSGIAKLTVGHPFDTIKVRLQTTNNAHFSGPLDCLLQTTRHEGVAALYKGATPPLVGWMVMDSVMLGSLTLYRRLIYEHVVSSQQLRSMIPWAKSEVPAKLSPFWSGIAGIMAGSTVSFVAAPVEHIKARLQIQYAADKKNRLYKGPIDCTTRILRTHGIPGLYRGLCSTLIFRSFFFFWWGTYDIFSRMFKQHTNLSTPAINFWAGGLSAQVFWMTSYPSDVVKQRIMTDPLGGALGDGTRKFRRWKDAAIAVGKESGWRGVDQTALVVNGTIINGLQSPPSGFAQAVVHAAIYLAATESGSGSKLDFQQLAVSHAAHDALVWVFHGTRAYNAIDSALAAVLGPIGVPGTSSEGQRAAQIGRKAAARVAAKRSDDAIHTYEPYIFGPVNPGIYQQTPGGNALPDTPQARNVRLFAGLGDVRRYRAGPPPKITDAAYETNVLEVKKLGEAVSSDRSEHDTDTAYFWRESSTLGWSRFANAIIGDSLAKDVVGSAKFYAKFNYALANAAIAAWDAKFYYNVWRPITAIRRPGVWLPSGKDISQPDWTPLLSPTPSHPDYVSTHATFGAAAAAVLRHAYNDGKDEIDASFSSNVTLNNRGVITRHFTNLTAAAVENARSRIFGGIHFTFAGTEGLKLGDKVARETLKNFDAHWKEF
ncbi:hypothetical protein FQN57_006278 [Myotisia sp. PD_48]|nr:hypothetical protein FQN57_006278 [Myotisia sp. PD_48]